ncbi:hypothetical protein FQA47_001972 [Oryzias melastigma]|uniref:Uncharacterized protein n=1 Tax=Oryzias melastigma TaxID=30732 RepID=A0A834CC23_ORYME|nr:hypothetical protein FQA47_001972 [Oryzias melastigma]
MPSNTPQNLETPILRSGKKKKSYYYFYRVSPQDVSHVSASSQREICQKKQPKHKRSRSLRGPLQCRKKNLKEKKNLILTDEKVRCTKSSATVGSRSLQHTLC